MNLLYHCEGELPTLLISPLTGGYPHIPTYEGTYETNDKIVVFGHGNDRFDIPKSEIIAVGMNVIVRKNFPELFVYKVDRNSPLPSGEPLEKMDKEAYPEYYHGPKMMKINQRSYIQNSI